MSKQPPRTSHSWLRATSGLTGRPTLKQRLAWTLRTIADRLDGGWSIRLQYLATPALSREQIVKCVEYGFRETLTLMDEEAGHVMIEQMMQDANPELYEDQTRRLRK